MLCAHRLLWKGKRDASNFAPVPSSLPGCLWPSSARLAGHAWHLLAPGWSTECLQEWDTFTSLAVPSMLMLCIEWWTYEIGSFLVGERGEDGEDPSGLL